MYIEYFFDEPTPRIEIKAENPADLESLKKLVELAGLKVKNRGTADHVKFKLQVGAK